MIETTSYFSLSVVIEPDSNAIAAHKETKTIHSSTPNQREQHDTKQEIKTTQSTKYNTFLLSQDPSDTTIQSDQWAPISMDSVFLHYDAPKLVYHKSIFPDYSMQPMDPQLTKQVDAYTTCWVFIIFSAIITTMSLYANNHRFMYSDIILSAFSFRSMTRILRDNNINRESALFPMTIIYAMGLSLVGLFISQRYFVALPFPQMPYNYLALFGILAAYLWVKNRLIALIGDLFDSKTASTLYNQNSHVYNFIAGLLLAPMSLVMFFNDALSSICLIISMVLLIVLFLLRLLRGLQLTLINTHHSRLYVIYYLLVFELIPLIIIGKSLLLY